MPRFTIDETTQALEPLRSRLISEAAELRADLAPLDAGIEPRTPLLSHIRGVLFDIYGTLLISAAGEVGTAEESVEVLASTEEGQNRLYTSVLRKTGFQPTEEAGARADTLYREGIRLAHQEEHRRGISQPEVNIVEVWARIIDTLSKEGIISTEVDGRELLSKAIECAFSYEISVNAVSSMPGASEIIAELRKREIVLGIVSNAQFYTPLIVEALLGSPPQQLGFSPELCIWSWELREAKPSARLFDAALQRLEEEYGIQPHEVLYIGNDMRNDIRPAKNLGCATALFAGDARSLRMRDEDGVSRGVYPEAILTSLSQLSGIVPA